MFGSKINPSGAKTDVGDAIANSILFDRADDPGITRTHDTTADSDKKVTISWWQKFTAEGNADSGLYVCFSSSKSSGNSGMDLYFNAGYAEWFFFNSGTIDGILRTNREFRDRAHLVGRSASPLRLGLSPSPIGQGLTLELGGSF